MDHLLKCENILNVACLKNDLKLKLNLLSFFYGKFNNCLTSRFDLSWKKTERPN